MTPVGSLDPEPEVPEEAVLIIGAGHFGGRAARLMCRASKGPVYVLDVNEEQLSQLNALPVQRIPQDGVRFLVDHDDIPPSAVVVPALPIHLAYRWVKGYLAESHEVEQLPIPRPVVQQLPHTWESDDGSLLVSYADFVCPEDCSEPDHCTVTGEKRETPLYRVLSEVALPHYEVYVIRSRQLAPGLGGYTMGDLREAAKAMGGRGEHRWLMGTACRCHGIVTAVTLQSRFDR